MFARSCAVCLFLCSCACLCGCVSVGLFACMIVDGTFAWLVGCVRLSLVVCLFDCLFACSRV